MDDSKIDQTNLLKKLERIYLKNLNQEKKRQR